MRRTRARSMVAMPARATMTWAMMTAETAGPNMDQRRPRIRRDRPMWLCLFRWKPRQIIRYRGARGRRRAHHIAKRRSPTGIAKCLADTAPRLAPRWRNRQQQQRHTEHPDPARGAKHRILAGEAPIRGHVPCCWFPAPLHFALTARRVVELKPARRRKSEGVVILQAQWWQLLERLRHASTLAKATRLTHVPAKWHPVRRQGHASTLESTAFPVHIGSLHEPGSLSDPIMNRKRCRTCGHRPFKPLHKT
jgi:hypothetical protein